MDRPFPRHFLKGLKKSDEKIFQNVWPFYKTHWNHWAWWIWWIPHGRLGKKWTESYSEVFGCSQPFGRAAWKWWHYNQTLHNEKFWLVNICENFTVKSSVKINFREKCQQNIVIKFFIYQWSNLGRESILWYWLHKICWYICLFGSSYSSNWVLQPCFIQWSSPEFY